MTRLIVACGVVFGLTVVYLGAAQLSPFAYIDDAFISFRYAENLADGQGLVYNPGERIEGYSTTLFVLLLAALSRLTGYTPTGGLIFGLLFQAATVAMLLLFLWRFASEKLRSPLSICALLFVLIHPSGLAYAESGMETSLASFLLLALAYALAAAERSDHPWRPATVAGTATVLLALTRPEMIILAAPAALGLLFMKGPQCGVPQREVPRRRQRLAPYILSVAAGYGAFLLWRHWYFGEWQPNTYYAKTAGAGLALVRPGLAYLWTYTNLTWLPYALLPVVLIIAYLQEAMPGWWWTLLAIALTHVAAVIVVGGDHFPMSRFFVPLTPLLLILLVQGVRAARQGLNRRLPNLAPLRLRVLLWIGSFLFLGLAFGKGILYQRQAITFVRQGLQAQSWCEIGLTISEIYPSDTSVALIPIGAFGYCSKLPIVDLVGLTDKVIARTPTDLSKSEPGHGRFNSRYVLGEKRPKLVFLQLRQLKEPVPAWLYRRSGTLIHLAARDLMREMQSAYREDYAFHRLELPEGYLHYFSRTDFEDPKVHDGAYPVPGVASRLPAEEPPSSFNAEEYRLQEDREQLENLMLREMEKIQ